VSNAIPEVCPDCGKPVRQARWLPHVYRCSNVGCDYALVTRRVHRARDMETLSMEEAMNEMDQEAKT
jgi:hypothetical protein